MLSDFLKKNIQSQASYVEYGYGQVEPNLLSAQRTGQIYAQLPAAASINVLEQGQFAKYNYAEGVVDFAGPGEWMLVFNEIKLYRDVNGMRQRDCEFAMIKDNYQARIYSPFGYGLAADGTTQTADTAWDRQSRYYDGKDADGNTSITVGSNTYKYDDVTAGADMYEFDYNTDPFHIEGPYKEAKMPEGTTMVPRLLKTNVGDIFTTNTITGTPETITKGVSLTPDAANGILKVVGEGEEADMIWQVVKVYTMPDHQRGVKIMRIK